jgi:hypothetical protein
MGYSTTFTVYTMPLTLNQVMSRHWRVRHANFSKIHAEVARQVVPPPSPLKRIRVEIDRYSSGSLDRDNAYFTFKPILDALVSIGVLEDDGWENVDQPHIYQIKTKRKETRKLVVRAEESYDL